MLVEHHQVPGQALYRGATCAFLEAHHDPDPTIRQANLDVWDVGRRIVAGPDWSGQPRCRRVNVDMTAELFGAIAHACRLNQFRQNGLFALVVMPWPDGLPGPVRQVRRLLLTRSLEIARDPTNQFLVPNIPPIDTLAY